MPRELVTTGLGQVEIREYPRVPLGDFDIRVKSTHAAAKHGTEMSFFKGYGLDRGRYDSDYHLFRPEESDVEFPLPLGNTSVGTVVEIGGQVTRYRVGDRVFAYGPFREEHVWPESAARALPAHVSWQAACCLDPVDFAVGAVRDGHVRLGDAVAVFGMGAIGLCALQTVRAAGADLLIAVEPATSRREMAQELGADVVLDPTATDVGLAIKDLTGKRGADVCIEYSGHHLALQQALRAVAYGGTVVAGAFPGAYPAGLDLGAEAHFNRPTLIFSRACSEPNPDYPNWDEARIMDVAWKLLCEEKITAEAIVRPVVDFETLPEVYPRIASDMETYLKLGARFAE